MPFLDIYVYLTVSGPAAVMDDVAIPGLVHGRVLDSLLMNTLHAVDSRIRQTLQAGGASPRRG